MLDCAIGNSNNSKSTPNTWKQSCTPLSHVCNGLSEKYPWMKFFVEASDESATLASIDTRISTFEFQPTKIAELRKEKEDFEKLINAKRVIRSTFRNKKFMVGLTQESEDKEWLLEEIQEEITKKIDKDTFESHKDEFESCFASMAAYYLEFVKNPENLKQVSYKAAAKEELIKNIWRPVSKFSDFEATNEYKRDAFNYLKPFLIDYVKNEIARGELIITEENKLLEIQQHIQHIFEEFGISVDAQKNFIKLGTGLNTSVLCTAISGVAREILSN